MEVTGETVFPVLVLSSCPRFYIEKTLGLSSPLVVLYIVLGPECNSLSAFL